jgi:rhamnogalacturonan endolyase
VYPSADSTELRIYTTTSPTEVRLRTLMHDPMYRTAVARETVGYNQPPHPSFFIGQDMQTPAMPAVFYAGKTK